MYTETSLDLLFNFGAVNTFSCPPKNHILKNGFVDLWREIFGQAVGEVPAFGAEDDADIVFGVGRPGAVLGIFDEDGGLASELGFVEVVPLGGGETAQAGTPATAFPHGHGVGRLGGRRAFALGEGEGMAVGEGKFEKGAAGLLELLLSLAGEASH